MIYSKLGKEYVKAVYCHPAYLTYTQIFAVVQLPSSVQLFATPWTTACQTFLFLAISWSLPKFMSIELVMRSNNLILCHSLILLLSNFPSFRVFSSESALCIQWPKYWSFRFSISPSKEYSGLISSKIDWFDLLVSQRTLKSLLQHHRSKAPILWCSAFFIVQLSHQYMAIGKTIASTIGSFVCKVTSLLLTHSRFVIAFLPRSNCLLISWLQSPSTVISETKKRKSVTTSTFLPSICHEMIGLDSMILVIFNI